MSISGEGRGADVHIFWPRFGQLLCMVEWWRMVENGEEEVRRMNNRKRWWKTSGYFKNCKIG